MGAERRNVAISSAPNLIVSSCQDIIRLSTKSSLLQFRREQYYSTLPTHPFPTQRLQFRILVLLNLAILVPKLPAS